MPADDVDGQLKTAATAGNATLVKDLLLNHGAKVDMDDPYMQELGFSVDGDLITFYNEGTIHCINGAKLVEFIKQYQGPPLSEQALRDHLDEMLSDNQMLTENILISSGLTTVPDPSQLGADSQYDTYLKKVDKTYEAAHEATFAFAEELARKRGDSPVIRTLGEAGLLSNAATAAQPTPQAEAPPSTTATARQDHAGTQAEKERIIRRLAVIANELEIHKDLKDEITELKKQRSKLKSGLWSLSKPAEEKTRLLTALKPVRESIRTKQNTVNTQKKHIKEIKAEASGLRARQAALYPRTYAEAKKTVNEESKMSATTMLGKCQTAFRERIDRNASKGYRKEIDEKKFAIEYMAAAHQAARKIRGKCVKGCKAYQVADAVCKQVKSARKAMKANNYNPETEAFGNLQTAAAEISGLKASDVQAKKRTKLPSLSWWGSTKKSGDEPPPM